VRCCRPVASGLRHQTELGSVPFALCRSPAVPERVTRYTCPINHRGRLATRDSLLASRK